MTRRMTTRQKRKLRADLAGWLLITASLAGFALWIQAQVRS